MRASQARSSVSRGSTPGPAPRPCDCPPREDPPRARTPRRSPGIPWTGDRRKSGLPRRKTAAAIENQGHLFIGSTDDPIP
jgi:hypothetical protein